MTDDLLRECQEVLVRANDRIEELEGILKRAVNEYDKAYCRDEIDFDWLDDARAALEGEK